MKTRERIQECITENTINRRFCQHICRGVRRIIISRRSRWYFRCGHSPLFFARTLTRKYGLPAFAVACCPQTGSSAALSTVLPFHLLSADFVCTPVSALCFCLPCLHSTPLHQTSLFWYLYFTSPNCSYSIVLLFPFWHPMKLAAAGFGGFSASMCVVRADFCLYDFYSLPLPQLSLASSHCHPFCFVKYLPSILWRKHYVIFAVPFRM